ncbi:MAG TPA: hypothetical protein VN213_20315 [Solirubrobacteraceae bacterium]|nr:hypothetical protein [Solirubrobacteraceae bacterium]
MPGLVMGAGFAALAGLAVAAFRVPAPRVSETAWACARTAVIPVSLLWMVSLTVCGRPSAFPVAMLSGAACCAVAWVMRAPPEPPLGVRPAGEDPGDGRGGDGDPPGDGLGGDDIDWDAFERAAFAAWLRHPPSRSAPRVPD